MSYANGKQLKSMMSRIYTEFSLNVVKISFKSLYLDTFNKRNGTMAEINWRGNVALPKLLSNQVP